MARTSMRGTQWAACFGIPQTDRMVELTGIHIVRIAGGRIVEHWAIDDAQSLMRQFGTIPKPGEPAGSFR